MDIRTLAAHLGLSIGTVSRALNGRGDVSDATRARVTAAADRLGYSPNQAGRSLRRRQTGTIAFVLPIVPDSLIYGDPFFLSVIEGAQSVIEDAGLELIVLPSRIEQDPADFLRRHLRRGIADGWILAATGRDDARIALLLANGIPFVTLGRSDTPGAYASVDLDFESMIDTAMARFIDDGHRRIALMTSGPGVNFSHLVIRRYRAALDAAGLPFDTSLVHAGRTNVEHCAQATDRFLALRKPPTAIFVMSENGPLGVYGSLRAAGLAPGRDIAVIGQRRTPACSSLSPSLACFSLDLRALGHRLGNELLSSMQRCNADGTADPSIVWPVTWVDGESAVWSG